MHQNNRQILNPAALFANSSFAPSRPKFPWHVGARENDAAGMIIKAEIAICICGPAIIERMCLSSVAIHLRELASSPRHQRRRRPAKRPQKRNIYSHITSISPFNSLPNCTRARICEKTRDNAIYRSSLFQVHRRSFFFFFYYK